MVYGVYARSLALLALTCRDELGHWHFSSHGGLMTSLCVNEPESESESAQSTMSQLLSSGVPISQQDREAAKTPCGNLA
jgi:hypothetical protein